MRSLVSIYFTFWCLSLYPQSFDLSITITGLKSTDGGIQIGLYKLYYLSVKEFSGICTIRDLPKGEYAVAIYHDKNSDKICNTNFLGVPKEGFGFSKNFKPKLSSPDFKDCKIDLNSNLSITIKLIYR
jgi:uncharacterized protein (DUF2141 family)